MSKSIINKKILYATVLCIAFSANIVNAEYSSLSEAIHDTTTPREYSFSGIEQVTANLGTMAAGTLTVTGSDGSGILGKRNSTQYSGVTVNSGSTLIMRNIGDASVDEQTGAITYNSGIEGFRKSGGGVIYNYGTLTLDDVVFYDNNGGGNYGSVIYNNNGHITKISGLILNNKNASGAIYNFGQDAVIDSIEADFVGNTNANTGAAILSEGNARISEIKNSHFFANSTRNSGGAIRTNVKSGLNTGSEISIYNSLFRYNSSRQGGAIQNGTSSTTNINNTVFDKNYSYNADSSTKEGGGGAIYNDGNLYITDSAFLNNATTYDGGAIYSSRYINNAPDSFVNIYAKNDNVLFSNNKSKVTSVSYSESAGYSVTGGQYNDFYGTNRSGLSLSANSGKSITFNGSVQIKGPTFDVNADNADNIKGGSYNFNNTVEAANMSVYNGAEINLGSYNQSDGTTSYGVLNLAGKTFTNDTNGGLIDTTNNHFDEQNFGSTTLNSDLNFNFDMNLASLETDTITANYSNGSGKIILSDVNLLGTKSWGDFLESDIGTKIKILNSNSNSLQLGLSSTLANTLSAAKVSFGTEEISRTDDTILATTNWEYDKYKTTIIEEDKYGQWELSKTSTENDSLEFKGTEIEKTRYETMGDTLMLVNQDTTNPTKNFNATNDGDVYNVTANLGTTNGTVNINGIADGSTETINLNGKTGFELSTAASELNFKDVTVEDNTKTPATTTIATVSNANAKIGLDNTVLNGNIDSNVSYDLTISGETTINGTVDNANATMNDASAELRFNSDTFADAALNAQKGTVYTKDSEYKEYDIGKLTSNAVARYNIDMNLSKNTQQTDQFVVGSGSTGTVYLTLSSVIVDEDMDPEQSVYIQIIKASGGSGPELNYDGSLILNQAMAVMSSDYLLAKGHGLYTKDTTNDSIMLRGVQDGFKAWVNLATTEHKEYTFEDDATYTIADTINLDGNDNAEIINNGTVINNGQLSEFTLTNNGNFTTDAEKIATTGNTITNNGTLTFTGGNNANAVTKTTGTNSKVVFSGTSTNNGIITQDNVEITSAGNVTNNALITASVLNNGELTSAADKLDGTITNDGTLNLTSGINNNVIQNTGSSKGTVNLSGVTQNNENITAKDINNSGNSFVNNSGAILTGNIKNTGNMTANANDLQDTDSSIVNDGILTLKGGANSNAITASVATSTVNFENVTSNSAAVTAYEISNTTTGDTVLSNTGDLQSTTFTNDGKFTNTGSGKITATDIVNNANGTLTSSAQNLDGAVNNLGTLNLSGTLENKTISGTGTTYVDSALKLNSGANIDGIFDGNNGNITISSGSVTNHNMGALKGDGNYTLDILYSTSGEVSIDTITLANDTTDSATVKIAALNEGGSRPNDFEKQVLIGANENTRLDISAIKSQFDMAADEVQKSVAKDLTAPEINWNDDYGTENWIETYKRELSVVGSSSGLMDTIKYVSTKIGESEHTYNPKADNLAIINQYNGSGKENREFNFDSAENEFKVTENTGITESGSLTINGVSDGESRSTIDYDSHNGFELNNDDTTLTLKDVEVKNSSALVSGTSSTGTKVVLDNVNIHDNGTGVQTAGDVEIKGNSTIADDINVTGDNSQINIDGTDEVTLSKNLTGTGTSKLNISNGTVNIGENTRISALDTTLNDTSLNIANENSLNGLDTTFNGTNNLNISNNNVGTLALGKVNLNGVLKMQVDADLAKAQMDQLTATSATVGNGGKIEVSKINLLSPTTQKRLDLLFTNNKNLASVVNYTGEGQIAYSPIYKYNTSYIQKSNGSGYFSFVTPGDGYNSFNPSVMASSVTAIVTGYQNQMQSLHDGFYHMERYMKHSKSYRFASENQNRVASLAPVTRNDINDVPETSQAMWTLPYSTFERVNLKGGVKVDNIAYGMTYGGDSNMFDMGHGFKGLVSAFIGYNGNHMSYDGISMTQNGGFLGATLNAYKGNFFTGLTVSTGASTGDAHTMYGQDNITLLTAGIANKTGYNFEFLDGKVILQPSLFLGYSWVNTFDYTNSAGVRINQDALNAMQIVPGIKIIGNTKNGWQPYAGIDMVWNVFMGRNRVTANDVILPQLSERAYVQYGVGVQKTWADRFTGFLQAMVRNGGRNGIVLSAGLRWTFGKENKKTKATASKQKTVIKSINK